MFCSYLPINPLPVLVKCKRDRTIRRRALSHSYVGNSLTYRTGGKSPVPSVSLKALTITAQLVLLKYFHRSLLSPITSCWMLDYLVYVMFVSFCKKLFYVGCMQVCVRDCNHFKIKLKHWELKFKFKVLSTNYAKYQGALFETWDFPQQSLRNTF